MAIPIKSTLHEWENDSRLLDYLKILAANGTPKKIIAKEKMGISYKTLLEWEKKSPIIKNALLTGWDDIADEIEGAMAKRARGYEYEEVKTIVLGDVKKGSSVVENQKTVKVEKQTKHMAADLGAQIFILKNKRPDKWKNDGDIKNDSTGQIAELIAALKDTK